MAKPRPLVRSRYSNLNCGAWVVYEPGALLPRSFLKRLAGNQILLKILARLTRGRWPWVVTERYQINERIVEVPFVLRSITEGQRLVLDLGCCESPLPLQLASLGHRVVAVDQDEYLARHRNLSFVRGDICRLSFHSNLFDVAVCLSTIEHVGLGFYGDPVRPQADLAAIREIWTVLKPRGRLLLTTPFGRPRQGWQQVYDWAGIMKLLSIFQVESTQFYKRVGTDWIETSREEAAEVDSPGETNAVVLVQARKPSE